MPKYFCEYCGIYLTHSSPGGRNQHSRGRKHINNKIEYYSQILYEFQQNISNNLAKMTSRFINRPKNQLDNKQNEIYFLYNGSIIEEELTLNEIINSEDNQKNKIRILVNDINNKDKSDEIECLKPSKNIICPNCKENIKISKK